MTFDYGPLSLRFAFLPGKEWTNPLGLCLAVSFFLALAVLPPAAFRKGDSAEARCYAISGNGVCRRAGEY